MTALDEIVDAVAKAVFGARRLPPLGRVPRAGMDDEWRDMMESDRRAYHPEARAAIAAYLASAAAPEWQPIETAPKDGTPILFANFDAMCLLSGAPHVWTGRYVAVDGEHQLHECSYAATNENGDPTHWRPLPPPPDTEAKP